MSLFGWSLPPGCGELPDEADDGFRACPKCGNDVEPPDDWRAVTAVDDDGWIYADHYVATYKCACGCQWESK